VAEIHGYDGETDFQAKPYRTNILQMWCSYRQDYLVIFYTKSNKTLDGRHLEIFLNSLSKDVFIQKINL
jgi:hypothetical protein